MKIKVINLYTLGTKYSVSIPVNIHPILVLDAISIPDDGRLFIEEKNLIMLVIFMILLLFAIPHSARLNTIDKLY